MRIILTTKINGMKGKTADTENLREAGKRIRLVIFDFDKTLCDLFAMCREEHARVKCNIVHMLRGCGIDMQSEDPSYEDIFDTIRFSHALPAMKKTELIEKTGNMLSELEETAFASAVFYDDAKDVFKDMDSLGLMIGIVSNNDERCIKRLIEGFYGQNNIFVTDRNNLHPEKLKPSPHMLNVAMREFGIKPDETVMVGDSGCDIKAAENAGCMFIGIIRDKDSPGIFKPGTITIKKLPDLKKAIRKAEKKQQEIQQKQQKQNNKWMFWKGRKTHGKEKR